MKKMIIILLAIMVSVLLLIGCEDRVRNLSAKDEQAATEMNQRNLNAVQPPPRLSWSLERDNLIKRFKLQNDRSIMFYMYVFIEGVADPIGYYQVNKVSSVNSQLTNTQQIVWSSGHAAVLPSPAEDGSYGENGNGVFGFTPEDIYIEHNMKYICSTVPLSFRHPVIRLTVIDIATEKQLKEMMNKIK
jgi:hypothetical protein